MSKSEFMKQRCLPRFGRYSASNSATSSNMPSSIVCRLIANGGWIHTLPEPITVANTICDYLRKGLNWDILTRRFASVELSNSIVNQVLLELKEPVDAKRALGFFHWSARQKHVQHDISNYCVAIHILIRAKLIRDAQALLESVLKRDFLGNSSQFSVVDSLLNSYRITNSIPLVFDTLVQTYAKLREIDLAFSVCKYLDNHNFTLSIISYNTLIHVVQKSDQSTLTWKIYEHMIKKRTYPNEKTVRIMIDALCKEGKLQEYLNMVDRIHGKRCLPAVIVNTSLVFRILEEGRVEEGIILLKRMLQKNMILDTISYSLIVYARVKLGSIDSAQEVYEEMLNRGFHANPFLCTLFIEAHCKEGKVEDAIRLEQEMVDMGLKPYGETYDHLIVGCSKSGRLEESIKFFDKMMEMGYLPGCSAFNEIVGKLCETGDMDQANEMLTKILDNGFTPNETTFCRLIAGYAGVGKAQEVRKLYYEMEYRSLSPGSIVSASSMSSLCRNEKLNEAKIFITSMKDR